MATDIDWNRICNATDPLRARYGLEMMNLLSPAEYELARRELNQWMEQQGDSVRLGDPLDWTEIDDFVRKLIRASDGARRQREQTVRRELEAQRKERMRVAEAILVSTVHGMQRLEGLNLEGLAADAIALAADMHEANTKHEKNELDAAMEDWDAEVTT